MLGYACVAFLFELASDILNAVAGTRSRQLECPLDNAIFSQRRLSASSRQKWEHPREWQPHLRVRSRVRVLDKAIRCCGSFNSFRAAA